jgi:hypothetical protein
MLKLLDIKDNRWIDFLKSQEQANIFHTPNWSRMLQQTYNLQPYFLVDVNINGEVTSGLPVIEKKSFLGNISWVSLPFTDHCAPLSVSSNGSDAFNQRLDQLINKYPDRYYELRWLFPEVNSLFKNQDYVQHKLTLKPDFEENYKLIHSSNNRNARSAVKNGIRIEINHDLQHLKEFYHLHLLTRRKQGVPIQPWNFFNAMKSELFDNNLGFIMTAYHETSYLAAAVFLLWNNNMVYKYGASNPAGLYLRPNDLLIQESIRWGCDHGYTSLDFGRSDLGNLGLRRFKSSWGSVESSLFYSYAPSIPKKRPPWMMDTLCKLIKNSPLWVCRFFGEILYRYAG